MIVSSIGKFFGFTNPIISGTFILCVHIIHYLDVMYQQTEIELIEEFDDSKNDQALFDKLRTTSTVDIKVLVEQKLNKRLEQRQGAMLTKTEYLIQLEKLVKFANQLLALPLTNLLLTTLGMITAFLYSDTVILFARIDLLRVLNSVISSLLAGRH